MEHRKSVDFLKSGEEAAAVAALLAEVPEGAVTVPLPIPSGDVTVWFKGPVRIARMYDSSGMTRHWDQYRPGYVYRADIYYRETEVSIACPS